MKKKIIGFLFFLLFVVLTYSVLQMPTEPNTNAPSYNDTTNHYLEESVNETGATNVVAAILADYRGFDTLGETVVLFTSIVAAASVLRVTSKKEKDKKGDGKHE